MKRADGPTPAGGAYSEARAFDLSGTETEDFNGAAYIRIDECTADGTVIRRTHAGHIVDRPEDRVGVAVSTESAAEANDPYNTDLTKGTWDVRRASDQKPVDNLVDLVETLFPNRRSDAELRQDLASFTVVPAFEAAPPALRREVEDFLAG